MKIAKIFSIITMMAFVGCFSAMVLQIGVANELVKEVREYESQIGLKTIQDTPSSFERVSYIKSRWNNSALYFAFAAFFFLVVQQCIAWKYLEKNT